MSLKVIILVFLEIGKVNSSTQKIFYKFLPKYFQFRIS